MSMLSRELSADSLIMLQMKRYPSIDEDIEGKYDSLVEDVQSLSHLFEDIQEMIQQQGEILNIAETLVENSKVNTEEGEKALVEGDKLQTSSSKIVTGVYIGAGILLGAGGGSLGILPGIGVGMLIGGGFGSLARLGSLLYSSLSLR